MLLHTGEQLLHVQSADISRRVQSIIEGNQNFGWLERLKLALHHHKFVTV